MSKDDAIEVRGRIVEALPSGRFRVALDTGQTVLAYVCGKLRVHYVRIVPGDAVMVEISAYDLTKGRIMYRLKHEAA